MAFEKLFPRKQPVAQWYEADEIDADMPTSLPEKGEPRYRVEIEVEFVRNAYNGDYPYQAKWAVYDTEGDERMASRAIHSDRETNVRTEVAAFDLAEKAARKWVQEQHVIDKGPKSKTVFIDG